MFIAKHNIYALVVNYLCIFLFSYFQLLHSRKFYYNYNHVNLIADIETVSMCLNSICYILVYAKLNLACMMECHCEI